MPRNWRDGYLPIGWSYDSNPKKRNRCDHESWSGAGYLPADVARITVRTRDGHTGEAKIADGYFAYRHIAPYQPIIAKPGDGASMPPVILTMYDARGKQLTSFDQNYLPPINGCPGDGGC